ncbi:hypothetical protein [Arthrobacter agilis]|uniref:hypothetical protein n=1 Tax=Arthrobacter agilis TaxID=37921 RepID=UPI002780C498|nr:hypothetical protein [Arthrobacter agilis]MDQ0735078.1 hypothetical protein [Arthrobacter agilis]
MIHEYLVQVEGHLALALRVSGSIEVGNSMARLKTASEPVRHPRSARGQAFHDASEDIIDDAVIYKVVFGAWAVLVLYPLTRSGLQRIWKWITRL